MGAELQHAIRLPACSMLVGLGASSSGVPATMPRGGGEGKGPAASVRPARVGSARLGSDLRRPSHCAAARRGPDRTGRKTEKPWRRPSEAS